MADYTSRQERRKAMQNNKGKNKKNNKKKKSLFKRILLTLVLVVLFMALAGSIAVAIIIHNAPTLDESKLKIASTNEIYGVNENGKNVVLATTGSQNRIYAPIDKIPQVVKDAVVSVEDARFYHHFGIDPVRIGGSVVANVKNGFGSQGASTIDQQLIKLSYLTPKKTLTRKIQEAYLAVKLDREYTKDQILEMYLNKINYNEGAYGVATAAKTYFGLSLNQLNDISLAQAAMLAGIPNLPAYYDPITHPDNAKKRRDLVLDMMVKNHKITQAQADKAKKVTIKEMLKNRPKGNEKTNQKQDYEVIDYIKDKYVGKGKEISDKTWAQGGLKIYTTFSELAQNKVTELLNDDSNFANTKKNMQAGIAIVDTKTGGILALGGRRHYNPTDYSFATHGGNQIGSTAKPIFAYGPAIEYMKWPTTQMTDDSPLKYSSGQDIHDWDGRYLGKMTIERALYMSRNVPAVRTLQEVSDQEGDKKIIDFANKLGMGIKSLNESYAIGSYSGVSPLQMATAYAAFGNGGIYNEAHALKSIVYPDGRKVSFDHDQHPAMKDYTAFMITQMLKQVISNPEGTYGGPSLAGYTVAGKSGSSNAGPELQKQYNISDSDLNSGYLDSWFDAYTPDISLSVWNGYDLGGVDPNSSSDMQKDGVLLLTPAEKHISNVLAGKLILALASRSTPDWKQPSSVAKVSVEKDTGLVASSNTPSSDIITGYYVKGTEPTKQSTKYQKIDAPTSLKATYNEDDQSVTLTWKYGKTSNISFEVSQKFNGDYQTLDNTDDKSITVHHLEPGQTYDFSVKAIYTDSDEANTKESDAATVTIKIPSDDDLDANKEDSDTHSSDSQNDNNNQQQNNNDNSDQNSGDQQNNNDKDQGNNQGDNDSDQSQPDQNSSSSDDNSNAPANGHSQQQNSDDH
ncbi:penicillin-binding protein 1A/1B [Pullulanibacillus camelliae]|uniref:Penicillin-binding protein 1A/1B n=1 Tax=Pullulanibacillus camelliae TaxID=1707096 RepID=A0A8J2YEW1_9BACL|nr:penicillin-binding protein 1A [Pullulanibacillus camelliae]GGE39074.1 penicillin-binding protein 1A/1B [Pullulanibacillus camelliae]